MLDKVRTLKDLSFYLGYPEDTLTRINPPEHYLCFDIPKPGTSEKRRIEAPTGILMEILERLCDGLQRIYASHKTPAAYGFVRSAVNDPDKRTIFSNASRHLNRKYLLNIDLDSFFYQITQERVKQILADDRFFVFSGEATDLISNLVVLNGRLPMGCPTSPPLSNFATYDLDYDLLRWSYAQNITFTRFVDDLSFSANFQLKPDHLEAITDLLTMHRFVPDSHKIKWYGPDDEKEVTGLIVGKEISLPEEYLSDVETEINRMQGIRDYARLFPDYRIFDWLRKIDRVIDGKLSFIRSVYGADDEIYRRLNQLAQDLDVTPSGSESISWRYAGYEYFS